MDLQKFFFPRSVVIVGVSESALSLGRLVIENLNRSAFQGRVYGVGRSSGEIAGRPVVRRIEDVPEVPDLAVLLIPARVTPDAIESCGKKGIRAIIIEAAGFSELGEEGKVLEGQVTDTARRWGIAVMGPNCVGTINMESRFLTPFIPFEADEIVKGRNSFISQSGGLVHELVRRCRFDDIGLSKMASIGNKLMLDENDVLDFLINDHGTDTIGLYLESVSDGRRLMNLASATRKPVIVLKANTSPSSTEIAAFHTSALTGDDALAGAAFNQAGIHRVMSLSAMVDSFKIFSLPPMKGKNLVIVARSGGRSVILADQAYARGFTLAELPPALFGLIKQLAKAGVIRNTNPIDMGDVFDDSAYLDVIDMVLQAGAVDGVVFAYSFPRARAASQVGSVVEGVRELSTRHQKPVVLYMAPDRAGLPGMDSSPSIPVFTDSERALDALRMSVNHYTRISREDLALELPLAGTRRKKGPTRILPPQEVFALLEAFDIPVVNYRLVRRQEEGRNAAREIGYPLVLKRMEPFVLHKTEAGAVRLNIGNGEDLDQAFAAMPGTLYLVQGMAPSGVDAIVGGRKDPEFGPVVVFGLGGIFVEVLKGVTMRVAPINERTAREMIDEIRGAALFRGARGTAPADVESLARVIANVSLLLTRHPEITLLDINPMRAFGPGAGCAALDVKMEAEELVSE
jgi:acetate---CoA ligase (ADP-forming)